MKRDKIFFAAFFALLFVVFVSVNTASAVVACNEAKVGKVGVFPDQPDKYRVELTCQDAVNPAWTGVRTFYISQQPGSDLGDAGYATILTAISLNATIKAVVVSPAWNSLLVQMFLNNPNP
ncbi:MAG: hypothetical protein D3925_10915 [Candidatus Electrothrix sp. AR5]|nr:hypothetical protein [Candidatus Electrothrix sp. AR5]